MCWGCGPSTCRRSSSASDACRGGGACRGTAAWWSSAAEVGAYAAGAISAGRRRALCCACLYRSRGPPSWKRNTCVVAPWGDSCRAAAVIPSGWILCSGLRSSPDGICCSRPQILLWTGSWVVSPLGSVSVDKKKRFYDQQITFFYFSLGNHKSRVCIRVITKFSPIFCQLAGTGWSRGTCPARESEWVVLGWSRAYWWWDSLKQ